MTKTTKAPLGAGLVVASSVFYASYGIWTKLTAGFFDGYAATALRNVMVLLILLPLAAAYHALQPLELHRNRRHLAGMAVFSAFTWGPLYYAIQHAGVGISLTVSYVAIILGSFFFGWLLGGERFTKDKALAAAFGIVGLGLVFDPTGSSFGWLALCAAFVSGLSVGANIVLSKQIHYNATQSTLALWTMSTMTNFLMAGLVHEHFPAFSLRLEWLYLLCFAVASVAASWLVTTGLKLIDAGTVGVLGLLEVVFGVLFGVVLFHERPGPVVLAGIIVIMLAAAVPYIGHYRSEHSSS